MVIATWGMSVIGGYRQVGCFSLEEDKGLGTNNHLYRDCSESTGLPPEDVYRKVRVQTFEPGGQHDVRSR
jgi:hypothetical protein